MTKVIVEELRNGFFIAIDESGKTRLTSWCPHWLVDTIKMSGLHIVNNEYVEKIIHS